MSFTISSGKVTFFKGNRSISSLNGITDSENEDVINYIQDLINAKTEAINNINQTFNSAIENIASQAENAVNNYINEHEGELGSNISIQDNSITLSKIVKGDLGYVTPEMWGAVGNGSTDDSVAVRKAFQEGCKKLVPIMLNGTYKVSSKIYLNGADTANGYNNRLFVIGNGRIKTISTIAENGKNSLDYLFEFVNFESIYMNGIIMYHDSSASGQAIVYGSNPANTAVTPSNLEVGITLENCTRVNLCNCNFSRFRYGIYVREDSILTENEFLGNRFIVNNCRFYDNVNGLRAGSYQNVFVLSSTFECSSETSGDTVTPHASYHIWATCNINKLTIDNCALGTFNEAGILLRRPPNTVTIGGQSGSIDSHIGTNPNYVIKDVVIHSTTIIGKAGNADRAAILSKSDTNRILVDSCNIRRTVPAKLPNESNHKTDIVKFQNCIIDTTDGSIWLGGDFYGCEEFGFYDCRIRAGRMRISGKPSNFSVYFKDCHFDSISTESAMFAYITEGTSAYLYLNDNLFTYTLDNTPKNNSTLPISAFRAKSGRIFAFGNRFNFNETGTTVNNKTTYSYVGFVFENAGDPPNGANAGANTFVLSNNIVNINKAALKRNSNGTGYGFFANKAKTRNLFTVPNIFPNAKGDWVELTTADLLTGKASDLIKYST